MTERQQQSVPDAVLTRIGQGVMLHHAGDREEARDRLLRLWTETGEHGDPLHRCTLAHYLADTQDDPADELAWDLRALAAAEELTALHPADHESAVAVRAFYPALHLNLAADYLKLDRADAARSHAARARHACSRLPDDGHGLGLRTTLGRLEARLAELGGGLGGELGEGRGGGSEREPGDAPEGEPGDDRDGRPGDDPDGRPGGDGRPYR
ncbi:hypothetical protein AB0O01_28435 [Streptomyces sp. NPDC093252]|uniref:hypothetical protein n=1 Tax=Streptomyces sp. NPDC093252 TaxID=3154980 RepID=UPI00344468A5